MKFVSCIALLALSACIHADVESIRSIDQFTSEGFDVTLVAIHDPLVLVLESDNEELVKTTYAPQYYDLLSSWKNDHDLAINGKLIIKYTLKNGIVLNNPYLNKDIPLSGAVSPHPIDWAAVKCRNKAKTTVEYLQCKSITLEAWENEIERAFLYFGSNSKFRDAQIAWGQFKGHYIDLIKDKYSSRQGTIQGLYYMDDVIELTRAQALRVRRLVE